MDWQTVFSTFGLVFIAELGDKTQLAVVTQTCKFQRPWPVFLGGSLALTAVTALGAIGGQLVGTFIPQSVVQIVAVVAFVVMGVLIWREAAKHDKDACESDETAAAECTGTGPWDWKAFGTTFSLLFFAELGDKTQLAVLGLSSKQAMPLLVFFGGTLALTAVTALGVVGGQQLCKWIPEHILLRISAVAFVLMGVLMGFGIL